MRRIFTLAVVEKQSKEASPKAFDKSFSRCERSEESRMLERFFVFFTSI